MKILLVDDDADIRKIARLSLEAIGKHELVIAASADEGIALARTAHPDLVLLDVMMPNKDGIAAIAELRADPATCEIPVVFMTAKVQHAEVERYLALGALGVIQKPFDPMTLPDELRRILATRR